MSKIVRHVFVGNAFLFWLLFISGIGMPFAILYLMQRTVRIEEDIQDPQRFVQQFGRYGGRSR